MKQNTNEPYRYGYLTDLISARMNNLCKLRVGDVEFCPEVFVGQLRDLGYDNSGDEYLYADIIYQYDNGADEDEITEMILEYAKHEPNFTPKMKKFIQNNYWASLTEIDRISLKQAENIKDDILVLADNLDWREAQKWLNENLVSKEGDCCCEQIGEVKNDLYGLGTFLGYWGEYYIILEDETGHGNHSVIRYKNLPERYEKMREEYELSLSEEYED